VKGLLTIVLAGSALVATAALPSLNGSREHLAALDRPDTPALRSDHATRSITQQHGQDQQ
jgi:hypothetical protein